LSLSGDYFSCRLFNAFVQAFDTQAFFFNLAPQLFLPRWPFTQAEAPPSRVERHTVTSFRAARETVIRPIAKAGPFGHTGIPIKFIAFNRWRC